MNALRDGRMRVFLTGGTGLVGSHVATILSTDGHAVSALARTGSDTRTLESAGAELIRGDLATSEHELASAMRGCDAVVHAAAIIYTGAGWDEYRDVNVDGTARIAAAAARAGVPRLLHVSSVAVYGGAGARSVREEDWRSRPVTRRDFYALSKRLAEEVAWEWHARRALLVTTVRPAVVFGERDRLFTPRLSRVTGWPIVPVPGSGQNTVTVVYAGNVAHAIVAALERSDSAGSAYNLAQDQPLTMRGLIQGLGSALGRSPRVVAVPAAPLIAGAAVLDAVIRTVPGARGPRLRRAVRLVTRDNPYDSSRARLALGFGSHVSHRDAFERTAAWLKAEGDAAG